MWGMLAEEKSRKPKDVLLEVTRAMGGRVGGSVDEFDEDGRASGLLGPPSRGGRLSRGDCWSAMGDVGFDEFRRWKRRWDSMTGVPRGGVRPRAKRSPKKVPVVARAPCVASRRAAVRQRLGTQLEGDSTH